MHAKRCVVGRVFAWINRNRRLAKYVEATIAFVEAFLYVTPAILLLRRLARCWPDLIQGESYAMIVAYKLTKELFAVVNLM